VLINCIFLSSKAMDVIALKEFLDYYLPEDDDDDTTPDIITFDIYFAVKVVWDVVEEILGGCTQNRLCDLMRYFLKVTLSLARNGFC